MRVYEVPWGSGMIEFCAPQISGWHCLQPAPQSHGDYIIKPRTLGIAGERWAAMHGLVCEQPAAASSTEDHVHFAKHLQPQRRRGDRLWARPMHARHAPARPSRWCVRASGGEGNHSLMPCTLNACLRPQRQRSLGHDNLCHGSRGFLSEVGIRT